MLDSFNSGNQAFTAKKSICGFIIGQISNQPAVFPGVVSVFLRIQHRNNYRFDCEFVLKYYSNRPIFCIPNSSCKMFEKRAPINLLQN